MTEREREVLKMCFGIGVEKHSRKEVAERLGITPERVRQIEEKALRRLEHGIRIGSLMSNKSIDALY